MYEQSSSNTTNNRNNTITICFFLIQLFLIFKKPFPVLIIFIDEKMGTSSTVLYLAILSILSVLLSNFSNRSSPSGCLLVKKSGARGCSNHGRWPILYFGVLRGRGIRVPGVRQNTLGVLSGYFQGIIRV